MNVRGCTLIECPRWYLSIKDVVLDAGTVHTKAACALRSHSAYGRYIWQDAKGILHTDSAKIASEELLDGKFLVSTSSMKMDDADVIAGYKQLYAIERVFRDMKNILSPCPRTWSRYNIISDISHNTLTAHCTTPADHPHTFILSRESSTFASTSYTRFVTVHIKSCKKKYMQVQ